MISEDIIFLVIFLVLLTGIVWQLIKNRKMFVMQYKLNSNNYIIYLFSLLIPLVGIIVGSIKLSKDDSFNRNIGVNCIVLGIVSMIIGGILVLK